MMKSHLRIAAVALLSSFAVAPQSFAATNDANEHSRMVQNDNVPPIDVTEAGRESVEMCIDESARYDEPLTDILTSGVADQRGEPILQYQARGAFDYVNNGSPCIDDDYAATWLGLHRGVNAIAPIFGAAPNELPNRSILSLLGIDESPVRSISVPAAEPAALKVFCPKPEYGAPCSNRCIKAGVGCAPMSTHPYKPSAGWGKLFACNTLFPIGHMCSFQFSNGDACHVPFGVPLPTLCVYVGGE